MKTTLQSEVELCQVAVLAEVAVWERRPELQRLCAAIGEQDALQLEDMALVLPGLSEAGFNNIVRHLEYLRLIDTNARLTKLGERCAETGEAPSWELGGYHFVVARHPLFGSVLVHMERVPPDGRDRDFTRLVDVPGWFMAEPARVWTSAVDPDLEFTVHGLPAARGQRPVCRLTPLPPASLVWHLDFESDRSVWSVTGTLKGERAPVTFRTAPALVPADRVAGLFASWEPRWDARSQRVRMPYDGKAVDGQDRFLRTLHYPRVKAADCGSFDRVDVVDVPVGPGSISEARDWALALAMARVAGTNAYCTKVDWEATWASSVRETPLEQVEGLCPSPDDVVRITGPRVSARTRWLLQAPNDLGEA